MENINKNPIIDPHNELALPPSRKGISSAVGIILIIVIAMLAMGAVFAYEYFATGQVQMDQVVVQSNQTNQVNETAGWKTYTDGDFNISFKYPNNCSTKTYSHLYSKNPSNFHNQIDFFENCADANSVYMGYYEEPHPGTNSTFEEIVNVFKNPLGGKIIDQQNIVVGGNQGIRLVSQSLSSSLPSYSTEILVPGNLQGTVLIISTSYGEGKNLDAFNQFVSTFKFTK